MGAQTPLRNLVLLMQENRSFDHYFGRFPGADGLPRGAPVTRPPSVCQIDPPHDQAGLEDAGEQGFSEPALTAYGEDVLPFYWTLARRFTLCDRYFAPVLGPTFPNRVFSLAASPGGFHANPTQIDPTLLPRPTIVDRLDAARVDWACYLVRGPDYNPVNYYPERRHDPRAARPFTEFLADAASGRLPPVAWLVTDDPLSEHPPGPPQWGQRLAALVLRALASGPQWPQAAMVLNYDESGGFYDHLPPRPGYRVPCLVVSPFARPGHVSHAEHDHASVLALIERTFGLPPLTTRDAAARPLDDCFDFDHPVGDPISYPTIGDPGCGRLPTWADRLLKKDPADATGWEIALLGTAGIATLGAAAWMTRSRRP